MLKRSKRRKGGEKKERQVSIVYHRANVDRLTALAIMEFLMVSLSSTPS